jgi:heptosyltransferase-2
MTTPAIAGIRKTFPRARISLLVRPQVAGIFEGNPSIDEILLYDWEGRHAGVSGLFRLAKELRSYQFHLAILLQNAFEAALLTLLAGIPRRVGYNTQGRGPLLTTAVLLGRTIKRLHHADYYQVLLKGLGWQEGERRPVLHLSKEAKERATELLAGEGVFREEPLIALNPGSIYGSAKRWPAERYAALADQLIDAFGVKILLTGAQGDRPVTGRVRSLVRYPERVIDLAGRTDLQVLAALLKRCRVYVTNDTGAMHVGAAMGVPLVAIFGSTDPQTTSPVGQHLLLRNPVPCSPCLLRECPIDHRCMTGISVEMAFNAVKAQYNAKLQ